MTKTCSCTKSRDLCAACPEHNDNVGGPREVVLQEYPEALDGVPKKILYKGTCRHGEPPGLCLTCKQEAEELAFSRRFPGLAIELDKRASTPQPPPTGEGELVVQAVTDDLLARAQFGLEKYGTFLRTNNGRVALVDAYQEALDLVMYLKQALMERER